MSVVFIKQPLLYTEEDFLFFSSEHRKGSMFGSTLVFILQPEC